MFLKNRCTLLIVAVLIVTTLSNCNKKWEEHNQVTNPSLQSNLMEIIAATSNLSKFKELLVKTGYDKVISSSKTYTVWAPSDQALQSLNPAIANDPFKLWQFVGNHISNQSYLLGSITGDQRIEMLNGKYIAVTNTKFDSSSVISPNGYANNGLIHVIDKFAPNLDNIWEFINHNSAVAPLMRSYLLSLDHSVFDPSKATQIGINPNTGEPVYDTVSGSVVRNVFIDSVMTINDESNQYTMILLDDNAYTTE